MLGSASLVHPGLGAGGLTDLSGLESLVSNSTGGVDPLGGHHSHHGLHSSHQLHQLHSGHSHSHHHHNLTHHLHHPPNQPLPPHRPFTPPGSLSALTSSTSSVLELAWARRLLQCRGTFGTIARTVVYGVVRLLLGQPRQRRIKNPP